MMPVAQSKHTNLMDLSTIFVYFVNSLGVQRLLIRKDHCFTRDLHQQFQGTIILMVFDLQRISYVVSSGKV